MHEVLVAGAGPAGAATAIHLAEAGRSVVLIDRAEFPRRKACGEGIFSRGVAELERLGVLDNISNDLQRIHGVTFHFGKRSVEGRLGKQGTAIGIRREVLDAALVERAQKAGVEVRTGVAVRSLVCDSAGRPAGVATDGGVERARVLVAADGLNSRLRRQAGLDAGRKCGRYGITAHVEGAHMDRDSIEVHFRTGYELYLTPVGCGVLNVALLGSRETVRHLAADGLSGFRRIVSSDAALSDSRRQFCDEPIVQGPFPARSLRAYRGRLVLAGDAAGFFDGITGEGVSLALESAKACARAVDQALTTGSTAPFRAYDREVRRLARNSSLMGRITLFLAQHPRLADRAIRNLARQPDIFEKLLAINAGAAGFRDLRPVDVLTMLRPK